MENKNELVRLSTKEVGKGIPITDTLIIAEKYQLKNLSVVKLIEKYKTDFLEFEELKSFEMTPVGKQRSQRCYELNEEQFYLLVTYMKNTEVARKYKVKFVKAFSLMKKEMLMKVETRYIGKEIRKSLTDSIKNCVTDESNFKNFAYSTYSKLVMKKVLGRSVKKAKEERGVKKTDKLRNFLSIEELKQVQELESKIATYIEFTDNNGKTDKEIYAEVKKYIENQK